MQRLRVAYNVGCRALCNLPWQASVSSHQVQCNIPTFEALLRKNVHVYREQCIKSNNMRLRAVMQSNCLYSFFLWTLQPYFSLWLGARMLPLSAMHATTHSYFTCGLGQGWTLIITTWFLCPTLDLVLWQVFRVSEQLCWESVYNAVLNKGFRVSGQLCLQSRGPN